MLAHDHCNIPRIDMLIHSDTIFSFFSQLVFVLTPKYLVLRRKRENCIFFGLTQPDLWPITLRTSTLTITLELKPVIYRTQDKHANYNPTDTFDNTLKVNQEFK